MVPPTSHKVPRVSWYSGSCHAVPAFAYGALALSGRLSQSRSAGLDGSLLQSVTPWRTRHGLGSSAFARRYSRNRCFFLLLRVLRCFSSPGSLPCVMDWRMGALTRGLPHSEIRGSKAMCASPRLIAACHVFHRLLVPRHPPCALCA